MPYNSYQSSEYLNQSNQHPMNSNPVLVETVRGTLIESFHRGAFAVVDLDAKLVASEGDIDRPIFPRSAIKPLQATVLIESGAASRYRLDDRQIALACASHSGESVHVKLVRQWLVQIGIDEHALECGAHAPSDRETRTNMLRAGQIPTALHNNCSGKHAGFLTVAKHCGHPTSGYIGIAHPVQRSVLQMLENLTGELLQEPPPAVDGCGIPTPAIPLAGIARGFVQLASRRVGAADQIIQAMRKHPYLVGGRNRFCTAIAEITRGSVLVKVGAEGVYAGMILDGHQVAFALKIDDGSRAAAEVAASYLIQQFAVLDQEQLGKLDRFLNPMIHNVAGREVGAVRPVSLL